MHVLLVERTKSNSKKMNVFHQREKSAKNVVLAIIPACWRCVALPGWQLGRPQQNPAKNDAEKDGVTYFVFETRRA